MKIINSNKKISATQSSKIIQKRHKCKRNQKELNQCSDNIQIDRWSQVYWWMGCMNSENCTISLSLKIQIIFVKFLI